MFRTGSLQIKLIGAFILMGAIVLLVALLGWLGNYRMNQYVTTLSQNTLPSIIGLWQINEGQTKIESAERWLLNPLLSEDYRREALQKKQQKIKLIKNLKLIAILLELMKKRNYINSFCLKGNNGKLTMRFS